MPLAHRCASAARTLALAHADARAALAHADQRAALAHADARAADLSPARGAAWAAYQESLEEQAALRCVVFELARARAALSTAAAVLEWESSWKSSSNSG